MRLGRVLQSIEGRAQKALFRAAERYRGRIIAKEGDSDTAGGDDVMKEWSANQIYGKVSNRLLEFKLGIFKSI